MFHPDSITFTRPTSRHNQHRCRGLTLLEAILAMSILSLVVITVLTVTTSAHQHQTYASNSLRAASLAEHLLDEIASRPYTGSAGSRAEYCVDDYNGFSELPGELSHADGTPYPTEDQQFSRDVSVIVDSLMLPGITSAPQLGKLVTVCVVCPDGSQLEFERFLPE